MTMMLLMMMGRMVQSADGDGAQKKPIMIPMLKKVAMITMVRAVISMKLVTMLMSAMVVCTHSLHV